MSEVKLWIKDLPKDFIALQSESGNNIQIGKWKMRNGTRFMESFLIPETLLLIWRWEHGFLSFSPRFMILFRSDGILYIPSITRENGDGILKCIPNSNLNLEFRSLLLMRIPSTTLFDMEFHPEVNLLLYFTLIWLLFHTNLHFKSQSPVWSLEECWIFIGMECEYYSKIGSNTKYYRMLNNSFLSKWGNLFRCKGHKKWNLRIFVNSFL